jgi:phenylalanyl-tRNA synthetase beta chain
MLAEKIPVIGEIALFDVYRGKSIAENKKSLAFLVLMQDTQKTLTDAEADEVMAKLLKSIARQHDAQLRS